VLLDGIATVLDRLNYDRVQSLWTGLQSRCEIPETRTDLIPHFTWHVSESYNHDRMIEVLKNFCGKLKPFTIRTSGLGIFSGEKPVVYINIVKDQRLVEIHRELWESFTPLAIEPSFHYSPEYWMPHITLFFDEIFKKLPPKLDTHQAMLCVLDNLARERYEWQIEVNNFAYGRMNGNRMQFYHYPFESI
jgi:2'-5' RNA ligase